MPATLLAALLIVAPGKVGPGRAPAPTPWALAGARSWRLCDELERQAAAVRFGSLVQGPAVAEEQTWSKRARQCPLAPEVLVAAAQAEILAAGRIEWHPDDELSLAMLSAEQQTRVLAAIKWLDVALAETRRRGDLEPLEARYLRAYAHVALGRAERAEPDLRRAAELGDAERWRTDRMLAVVKLMRGDLPAALRLAHRGLIDAPFEDRTISRYIWALVLDRVGAQEAARATLRVLRAEPGHSSARTALMTLLPVHERLFLRAIDHQASGEGANAIRLWDAYLGRPEPEEPERELARRHAAELAPVPARVGGPMGVP